MKVELGSPVDGRRDLFFNGELVWRVSEHDLRAIENTLARHQAGILGRSCPAVQAEHTCALDSGHDGDHACRGCEIRWFYFRALSWADHPLGRTCRSRDG